MSAYREMLQRVHDDVEDQLQNLDDASLQMAFRDGIDFNEVADGAVPVYHGEIFEALVEAGLACAEPEIEGATNPAQMAQHVLYEECLKEAYDAFETFKDDEEDQRERFWNFLQNAPEEYDDAEEAYCDWTDDPRRDLPDWHDDSGFYEDIFEEWRADRHEQ